MSDLILLFLFAFLAATIIPAQSELVLAALCMEGRHGAAVLIAVATLGNVLGSCVNWLLGHGLLHFRTRRWFPVKEATMERAMHYFRRFGVWSLLFAWLPFIGDALTVAAGFLRTPFCLFLTLVTLGKAARYITVILLL